MTGWVSWSNTLRLIDLLNEDFGQSVDDSVIQGVEISGLACDSRRIEPGFLFAAIPGFNKDGRDYINDALRRGASAIIAPFGTSISGSAIVLTVENTRLMFAQMASRFFEHQPATVVAVTGTNGKTSVVSFVRQIWENLGKKGASLGTMGIIAPGFEPGIGLTTPDSGDLHKILADLWKQGIEALAMEASSHGLHQHRLDAVNISAAGFTNLSRDHLDYHGSVEEYFGAKKRLFCEILRDDGVAVLNADDEFYLPLRKEARGRIISYGRKGEDIRLDGLSIQDSNQHLYLNVMGNQYEVTLPLSGAFQIENALCALGIVLADSVEIDKSVSALENLEVVPGRLQFIGRSSSGAPIYVDFAHTPQALASILKTLRPYTKGSLSLVFGCGGERDKGKRAEMGRVACQLADRIIITDDNPRKEDASAIRGQILTTCVGAKEISDRRRAIREAISLLKNDDVLIIAGKGHENVQILANREYPFNDADEIRSVLEGRA